MVNDPFAGYRSFGQPLELLHWLGNVAVARQPPDPRYPIVEVEPAVKSFLWGGLNKVRYVVRYRNCICQGDTVAQAIAEAREAYRQWEKSEGQLLTIYSFLEVHWTTSDYFSFKEYNGITRRIDASIGMTRGELRVVVNMPARRPHNFEHYRHGLGRLGIHEGSREEDNRKPRSNEQHFLQ